MMILVPSQIISIPQYMMFRNFGFGGLSVNLINSSSVCTCRQPWATASVPD